MATFPDGLTPDTSRTYTYTLPSSSSSCPSYPSGVTIYTGCPSCGIKGQSKQSGDTLDYTVDFSSVLSASSDSVASFTSVVLNPKSDGYDITIVWSVLDGNAVTLMLTSGHAGSTEEIEISAVTTQGRTFNSVLSVPIGICTPSVAG